MKNLGYLIMGLAFVGLMFETIDVTALGLQLAWWGGCFTVMYGGYRLYRFGGGRSIRDLWRQPE